jgi:hypothetical protein
MAPAQQTLCAWTFGFVRSDTVGSNSFGVAFTFHAIDKVREVCEREDEGCGQNLGYDDNHVHFCPSQLPATRTSLNVQNGQVLC